MRTVSILLATGWLLASASPCNAASTLERLVMPGALTRAHADLEDRCRKCHAPFSRELQGTLCRQCHTDVDRDITAGAGFHGRSVADQDIAKCQSCHTEHEGREANIVKLDPARFDHERTDYPLRGAHLRVACAACHRAGKKYRQAPATCVECHRGDDRHKGALGDDCKHCHSEQSWNGATFDHASTGFALTGAHTTAACAKCHPDGRYDAASPRCVSCHATNDVHRGTLGTSCEKCHATQKWRPARFDHLRDAGFALAGKHAAVSCKGCHTSNAYRTAPPTACVACHRKDDVHRGSQGADCQGCHSASGWRVDVRFDHDLSRFPLLGKHATIACSDCHRTKTFRDTPTDCIQCHRDDDAHHGLLGRRCAQCHNPTAWRAWIFDHDTRTRFPLDGAHVGLQCQACHTRGPVEEVAQPATCGACHGRDDVHLGQFGDRCERCHTTMSFRGATRR